MCFPVPDFLPDTLLLVNLLTFSTLAIELSIGILIWNRTARPYVMALGLMLHLGIEYRIRVGFFLGALLTSYLAFVPSDRMDAVLAGVRKEPHELPVRNPLTASRATRRSRSTAASTTRPTRLRRNGAAALTCSRSCSPPRGSPSTTPPAG